MVIRAFRYRFPFYVYAGIIFYLSNLSYPLQGIRLPGDKWLHLIEYTIFGFLAARAFRISTKNALAMHFVLFGILASFIYGVSDELHQAFIPGRECSFIDLIADVIGGVLGALIYQRLTKLWQISPHSEV